MHPVLTIHFYQKSSGTDLKGLVWNLLYTVEPRLYVFQGTVRNKSKSREMQIGKTKEYFVAQDIISSLTIEEKKQSNVAWTVYSRPMSTRSFSSTCSVISF